MKTGDLLNQAILQQLYEAYFRGDGSYSLYKTLEAGKYKDVAFWNAAESLSARGLIEAIAGAATYGITATGIIYSEDNGIVPDEIVQENRHARTLILAELADVHESQGYFADEGITILSEKIAIETTIVADNLGVLCDLDYVESVSANSFKITQQGLLAVEEWMHRKGFEDKLELIERMKPQPRGRALQKLVAEVLEHNGWSQEEGVRTSNEEIDIIIHKVREYYLIECKWENPPIEADVVRAFYGKLCNRVGVNGLLFSMSGFTSGAVEQAIEYSNSRIILLFGPKDIRSLIESGNQFDNLLDNKYQQLVTRKLIVFE